MSQVSGLSRCLSWEEEPGRHVLEVVAAVAGADERQAVNQPPAPPSAPCRDEEVVQLQAYLEGLGGSGAELPDVLPALVQRLVEARRQESSALRGWVAAASTDAPAPVASGAPQSRPSLAGLEPKLGAALLKVQQLDGALAAADERAAVVAAAGRELELRGDREAAAGGSGNSNSAPAGNEGALAGAMARQRRLLQHEERVLKALQEGDSDVGAGAAPAGSSSGAPENSSGSGGSGCLTRAQEALIETLLGRPDAEEASAAPAAVFNPYDHACSQLAAIDAQLAALGSAGGSRSEGHAADGRLVAEPAQQLEQSQEQEEEEADLDAARASYRRAQTEARVEAQHLRSIEAALRAVRTGASTAAAC